MVRLGLFVFLLCLFAATTANKIGDLSFFGAKVNNLRYTLYMGNSMNETSWDWLETDSPNRYEITNCEFKFSWNPAKCIGSDASEEHTILLSFLKKWTILDKPTKKDILESAIEFKKNTGSSHPSHVTDWARDYPYDVSVYKNGKRTVLHENLKVSMINPDFYARIVNNHVQLVQMLAGTGNTSVSYITKIPDDVIYFALFSTRMEQCPTAITAISRDPSKLFPAYLPGDEMNSDSPYFVKGKIPVQQKKTTVYRDVFLACTIIFAYTTLLINYIFPLYFDFTMPIPYATGERNEQYNDGEAVNLATKSSAVLATLKK